MSGILEISDIKKYSQNLDSEDIMSMYNTSHEGSVKSVRTHKS